jgi:hypothetical protein
MRPDGGVYGPELVRRTVERYGFASFPDLSRPETDASTILFKHGQLISGNRKIAIHQFNTMQTGIVVDTHTTEEGDLFLDDVLSWAEQHFRLKPMLETNRRQYISTVIVEFDEPLDRTLKAFSEISNLYTTAINQQYGQSLKSEIGRLTFSCDPLTVLPNMVTTDFNIERRGSISFKRNRFYCQGPVPTLKLIDILAEVERIFGAT